MPLFSTTVAHVVESVSPSGKFSKTSDVNDSFSQYNSSYAYTIAGDFRGLSSAPAEISAVCNVRSVRRDTCASLGFEIAYPPGGARKSRRFTIGHRMCEVPFWTFDTQMVPDGKSGLHRSDRSGPTSHAFPNSQPMELLGRRGSSINASRFLAWLTGARYGQNGWKPGQSIFSLC